MRHALVSSVATAVLGALALAAAGVASAQTAAELQTRIALAWAERAAALVTRAPAHPDVVALEAAIRALSETLAGAGDPGRADVAIATLDGARAATAGELATASARYGARHPTILALEARLAALDEALASLRAGRPFVPIVPTAPGGAGPVP